MGSQAAGGLLPCRATSGSTCSTSGRPHAAFPALQHPQSHQFIEQQPSRRRQTAVLQAGRTDAAAAPPGEDQKARLASLGGVVTDDAVPEGHKGLHGFLYGDGGAEEHDSRGYAFRHVCSLAHRRCSCFTMACLHVCATPETCLRHECRNQEDGWIVRRAS